ncbi:MAG: NUDIX domain-containing protein [Candidatus Hodarchaeota archaeon]
MVLEKYLVAADAIIVDEIEGEKQIVLIKRKNPPFQEARALPGGILDPDESVEQCCIREAKEETSLDVEITKLVGVYSEPGRDPRGRTISVTYLCKPVGGKLKAMDDAADAKWFKVARLKELTFAFDHDKMLEDAGLL